MKILFLIIVVIKNLSECIIAIFHVNMIFGIISILKNLLELSIKIVDSVSIYL